MPMQQNIMYPVLFSYKKEYLTHAVPSKNFENTLGQALWAG